MADRVKAVAEEEGTKLRRLSVQAVQSRAYLYPLHGLAYFASHRALQKPFLAALLPSVGLGLATTVALFALLYLPQAAALAFTQGPFAAVSAALLVLNESAAVTTFLGKNFVVADALVDTFDATLLARGGTDRLVQEGRQLGAGGDPVARLGKIVKKPFERLSPNAIIRYVMYLPLNFIPVVGSVIFVVLQGRKVGPAAHERYFQLKGMKGETKRRHVEEYQAAYTRQVLAWLWKRFAADGHAALVWLRCCSRWCRSWACSSLLLTRLARLSGRPIWRRTRWTSREHLPS